MRYSRLFLIFLFLIPSFSAAKNRLVYYEPKFVELTGIITHVTFPGPPNYESIKNGDLDETGPYLILKNPIDVDLAPNTKGIGNDVFEKNVKLFQLVMGDDQNWEKMKEGNCVRIKGRLFRAIFGHHHSRVLLDIAKIDLLPKKKITAGDITITKEDYAFMSRKG